MAQRVFAVPIQLPGTITADKTFDFKVPFACQLIAVSALVSTNDANIKVGTSSDDDAYVDTTDGAITAGTVLLLDDKDDFVDDQYPHIAAETQVRVTCDHTGSNPADFIAVLYFTEG